MAECFVEKAGTLGNEVYSFSDCTTSIYNEFMSDRYALVFPAGVVWGDISKFFASICVSGEHSVFRKNQTTQKYERYDASSEKWRTDTGLAQPLSTDNAVKLGIATSLALSDWDITLVI